jgi:cell division septum initiation protein DivIVA
MTHPSSEQFEIVRRGYDPRQVDHRFAELARELDSTGRRAAELERRVEELHLQSQEPPARGDGAAPLYAGLGVRVEQILALAEEEARELRAAALEDAEQHRALTEQDAATLRAEAERYAQERRSESDAEAARVLEEARRQADKLRDETERDTKARREEAEALFERNRAKAAQAAADFETTLAHRREQSERDFTEQMRSNEARLAAVQQRAEQLRLEAEKLRADADRKSTRLIDEARRQADDVVAEAKATAERIRAESERELAAATQRRDSINAQLTNVRQMLATLTGATLPNPLGDEESDTTGQPDGAVTDGDTQAEGPAGGQPPDPAVDRAEPAAPADGEDAAGSSPTTTGAGRDGAGAPPVATGGEARADAAQTEDAQGPPARDTPPGRARTGKTSG